MTTSVSPVEAPPVRVTFDVAGLHPVGSARSVVDVRGIAHGALAKVHVDPAVLLGGGGTNVEPWLGRRLFAWLVQRVAEVRAVADGSTVSLVGTRFVRVTEHPAVSVERGDDGVLSIAYRATRDQPSLCAPDLTIAVEWVQFEAALVTSTGRSVAVFAEAMGVQPPMMRTTVMLPADADPCAALPQLFEPDHGAFAPSEQELGAAADAALASAFRSLVAP